MCIYIYIYIYISAVKFITVQRRLARPLRKDDTHKSEKCKQFLCCVQNREPGLGGGNPQPPSPTPRDPPPNPPNPNPSCVSRASRLRADPCSRSALIGPHADTYIVSPRESTLSSCVQSNRRPWKTGELSLSPLTVALNQTGILMRQVNPSQSAEDECVCSDITL